MSEHRGLVIREEHPIGLFRIPRCYQKDLSSVMIPKDVIRDRVKQMASEIHSEVGDQPVTMICVLKGAYRFFTLLVEELTEIRHECLQPVTIDFIRVKSYEDDKPTSNIKTTSLIDLSKIRGENVIIVDDISDTGRTIYNLIQILKESGAKQIWTAVLVSKRTRRTFPIPEDFVAFNIPDKFIVGYGMDYNQIFRDLNHICVMNDAGIEKYRSEKHKQTDNGVN